MPHLLTDEQKRQRVKVVKKLLQMFQTYDKKQFANVFTGEETWVNYYEPVRKVSNKIWATKHSKRPIIAKRSLMSLSDDKEADIIDAFNTTSRYMDDILKINNIYFDTMVNQIYSSELQLNKANTSDTEAAFLDLHLSISNDIVSAKIDKHNDFAFKIVNLLF